MSDKLRGLPIPEECNELNRISWANYISKLEQENKKEPIIIESTPNGKKGFYWNMMSNIGKERRES